MRRMLSLFFIFAVVPILLGCPGNSAEDKRIQEELWAWIQQQDTQGWTITGYESNAGFYKGIVVAHEFRPTRLLLAIKGDQVNPLHQRNLLEDIARKWRSLYPVNMVPRYNMKVVFYDMEISNDRELGYTEIDRDGNVDTHHSKTQDIL